MQDRHIGDVRVTRIEEQMGPGFPAKDFFPEFEAETFDAERGWLAPNYYQSESEHEPLEIGGHNPLESVYAYEPRGSLLVWFGGIMPSL